MLRTSSKHRDGTGPKSVNKNTTQQREHVGTFHQSRISYTISSFYHQICKFLCGPDIGQVCPLGRDATHTHTTLYMPNQCRLWGVTDAPVSVFAVPILLIATWHTQAEVEWGVTEWQMEGVIYWCTILWLQVPLIFVQMVEKLVRNC